MTVARGVGRREVLIAGALGGTAVLAGLRRPASAPSLPMLDTLVPSRIGEYVQGVAQNIVLPPPTPLGERVYAQVLSRLYEGAGVPPIMLVIAQARSDAEIAVHRPERCYAASGYSIESLRPVPLPAPFPAGAAAVAMTARREARCEQIFYWTRVESSYPATGFALRWAMVEANLAGRSPTSMLLRLSIVDARAGLAQAALRHFHQALVATLDPARRQALLGR